MLSIQKIFVEYWKSGQKIQLYHDHFPCENEDIILTLESKKISENAYYDTIHLKIHSTTNDRICLKNLELDIELTPIHHFSTMFVNGFQSWTQSREYQANERLYGLNPWLFPVSKHYRLPNYGDYNFRSYPARPGNFHSYTYTYFRSSDKQEKSILLLASLSEKFGYTIFHSDFKRSRCVIQKECEQLTFHQTIPILQIFSGYSSESTVFSNYWEMYAKENPQAILFSKQKHPICTGWTSWYHYYQNINESIIIQNLSAFRDNKVPIQIFQIDDGYQQAVGDWEANSKFPQGMKWVSDQIHQSGYQAGLWLAPFICEEKSELRKKHPDWLLSSPQGKPFAIGNNPFHWSGNFYALNFTLPAVQEYLRTVFTKVLQEWEFDLVKLDFLYAVAWMPLQGKSRGQLMNEAMQFLREVVGNKKILGCGVPLGSAFGKVDYCRIGSDVALDWEDKRLRLLRFRERASTWNSLLSTIHRRHLNHPAFANDPDVFILRDDKQNMTWEERKTLLILNILFGSLLFTSDNIAEYSPETLNLYRSLFPFPSKTIHSVSEEHFCYTVKASLNNQDYMIYANLSEKPYNIRLDGHMGECAFPFWQNNVTPVVHEQTMILPPHTTKGYRINF